MKRMQIFCRPHIHMTNAHTYGTESWAMAAVTLQAFSICMLFSALCNSPVASPANNVNKSIFNLLNECELCAIDASLVL